MCGSRKYPYLPHRWFFTLKPHPSGNSNLASYFPLKILAFETPHPSRFPTTIHVVGMHILWSHTMVTTDWSMNMIGVGALNNTAGLTRGIPCHDNLNITYKIIINITHLTVVLIIWKVAMFQVGKDGMQMIEFWGLRVQICLMLVEFVIGSCFAPNFNSI